MELGSSEDPPVGLFSINNGPLRKQGPQKVKMTHLEETYKPSIYHWGSFLIGLYKNKLLDLIDVLCAMKD